VPGLGKRREKRGKKAREEERREEGAGKVRRKGVLVMKPDKKAGSCNRSKESVAAT